jgi:hypothetical protein
VAIDLLVQHIKRQLRKRGVQVQHTTTHAHQPQPSYYLQQATASAASHKRKEGGQDADGSDAVKR